MNIRNFAVAAAAFTVLAAPQVAFAGDQDFTLVNRTGYEIDQVYVSPAKAGDWEEDVLGRDTLADGDRVEITFDRGTDVCRFDLKVVYTIDSTSAEWANVNLCEISSISIFYNDKTDTTSATYQ